MRDDAPARRPKPESSASRETTGEKYERLLDGAAELMARQGYSQTTMRDVARETGFSLAGMYYYFKSKEDLLYQIQQRTFSTLLEEQRRLAGQGGPPAERLERLIRRHLAFCVSHAAQLKVCTFELDSLGGDAYEEVEKIRRGYFALVAGILAELLGRDGTAPARDPAVRHKTLFLFGMLNWIFMWYRPERDGNVGRLAAEMTSFVLGGLAGDAR